MGVAHLLRTIPPLFISSNACDTEAVIKLSQIEHDTYFILIYYININMDNLNRFEPTEYSTEAYRTLIHSILKNVQAVLQPQRLKVPKCHTS
jgi:hypothetical protein